MDCKNETYFYLDGIQENLRDKAIQELNIFILIVKTIALESGIPFLLKEVVITSDFEQTVNNYLMKNDCFSGYKALREEVRAFGKVICKKEESDFGFVIIIDSQFLGTWPVSSEGRAIVTILHELCHVYFYGHYYRLFGKEFFINQDDSSMQLFKLLAYNLMDEHKVDKMVDAILRTIAKNDRGTDLTLLDVENAYQADFYNSSLESLRKLPEIIEEKIHRFKIYELTILELLTILYRQISDTMILITHTDALYTESDKLSEYWKEIKETKAYKRFLSGSLERIFELIDSQTFEFEDESIIDSICHELETIFLRCGLEPEPVSGGGVYWHVNWPE